MFIGIDIGTSTVKAILTDPRCRPKASSDVPLRISHPHAGWSEQAPEDWWNVVQNAVRNLLRDNDGAAEQVQRLGLSGQMHGAVLLDDHNHVIRPAILWNDGRSAAQCADLQARAPELAAIAGVTPMTG